MIEYHTFKHQKSSDYSLLFVIIIDLVRACYFYLNIFKVANVLASTSCSSWRPQVMTYL